MLYAHSNRVVHRALSPHAIWSPPRGRREVRVLVGDWQTAGSAGADSLTGGSGGVTALFGAASSRPGRPRRLSGRVVPRDADSRLAKAFQAPEGAFTDRADRIRLDVFALGALGYYVLAGAPGRDEPRRHCAIGCAARTAWISPPTCRRSPRQHGT